MTTKSASALANIMNNKKPMLVAIALISVYIFWGGTYLGMKIAIETIPS